MSEEYAYKLPCEPVWVEGIYQIEVTDKATGYSRADGTDGVANTQAWELGNRTLHLKGVLEKEHGSDGRHALKDANFEEGSFTESQLALEHPTSELMEALKATETRLHEFVYQAVELNRVDTHTTNAIRKMLPLSYEYREFSNEYELFTEEFKLGEYITSTIIGLDDGVFKGEVQNDDSLDVDDTSGFVVGDEYYIYDEDGGRLETATLRAVLNSHRLRFMTDLGITRETGIVSTSSLYKGKMTATASYDWKYRSKWFTSTMHAYIAELIVNRADKDGIAGKAYFQHEGGTGWIEAPLLRQTKYADGSVDDVYQVPTAKFRFKLEYGVEDGYEGESPYPYKVNYMAVLPDKDSLDLVAIRRPTIEDVEVATDLCDDDMYVLHVETDGYGTLYGIRPDGASASVSLTDSLESGTVFTQAQEFYEEPENQRTPRLKAEFNYLDTEKVDLWIYLRKTTVPESGGSLYLFVRFYDHENSASQWSTSYQFTV